MSGAHYRKRTDQRLKEIVECPTRHSFPMVERMMARELLKLRAELRLARELIHNVKFEVRGDAQERISQYVAAARETDEEGFTP